MRFFLFLMLVVSAVHAADALRAFPTAGEGMSRHVIFLPTEKNEDLLKVQLMVGKIMKLDPQNRYFRRTTGS